MKRWWAAQVTSGKEYDIRKKIENLYHNCDLYIPRKLVTEIKYGKITQQTERLLPGYLIIGTEEEVAIGMVEGGGVKIIGEISEEELKNLKTLEYTEKEYTSTGSKIIVTEGPLMGSKGTVLENSENGMTKCKIHFKGIEIEVDMKPEYLNTI